MQYLKHEELPEFIAAYYGNQNRGERTVGIDRAYDSGYFDIVRFFGTQAVNPLHIRVTYADSLFRISDPLIREYAAEIELQLRAAGRLHDGPTVTRLMHLDANDPFAGAVFQEALYGEQAGSSFALDYPHPAFTQWGGTLRHYCKTRYPSLSLEDNPLGICLGVCGMLLVEERSEKYVLLVRRHGGLATLEDSIGPSVAGAVDWSRKYVTLDDTLTGMLGQELQEELHLQQGATKIIPLAYAREILRGDRPQLFGLARTELPQEEVIQILDAHRGEKNEYGSFELVRLEHGRLSPEILDRLNFEARMSYYLAEEYLAAISQ